MALFFTRINTEKSGSVPGFTRFYFKAEQELSKDLTPLLAYRISSLMIIKVIFNNIKYIL